MAVDVHTKPAIEVRELPFRHTAAIRTTVRADRLPGELERIFESVMLAVGRQGLAASGAPFARFHRVDRHIDVEAGIPLAQPIEPLGKVQPSSLPDGPCVHATCQGGHPCACSVAEAAMDYAAHHALQVSGSYWESYEVRSTVNASHEQLCTELFLPVKRSAPNRP